MTLSDAWIDFIAGWCSGGVAVIACQPIDTILTRYQAGNLVPAATTATTGTSSSTMIARNLIYNAGSRSLWRGSSAMIAAVPMQNALLMGGYGVGKKWCDDVNHPDRLSAIFVGGCVGGVLQSFLMSPVELIKVNQQVIGKTVTDAGKEVFGGLLTATTASVTTSASAWRGLGATLLRDGIPHGVWFVSYEMCKNYLEEKLVNDATNTTNNQTTQKQLVVPLVSGAFAATVAWGVGYPFDLIKTRIQAGGTLGIIGTGQELVQQANGRFFVGLYKGFGLKLVRAIPASMIGFTTYEFVAKQIQDSTTY